MKKLNQNRMAVLKNGGLRMLIGELVLSLGLVVFLGAFVAPSMAASGGSVTGDISVKKAYVPTDGPKGEKAVVVSLIPVNKTDFPAVTEHAQMNQKDLNFVPHVLAIQKGTTVDFMNQDAVNHNVSCPDGCCSFDLGQWGKGVVKSHLFEGEGVATLLCSLHPEMLAYIVVVNTPYFTTASLITDNAAKKQYCSYSIKGVPAGQYKLKVWNAKVTAADQVITVADGTATTADIELHKK